MRIEAWCWCDARIEVDDVNHEDLAHVSVLLADWRDSHRCRPVEVDAKGDPLANVPYMQGEAPRRYESPPTGPDRSDPS